MRPMDIYPRSQINQFILQKQHLTDDSKINGISQITKDIGGLHCTCQTTPYLSLFNRANNFSKDQLDEEAYKKRNLGKIRCIRKTVFIHHKEFIPWIIKATRKQYEKRHVDYLAYLGVPEERYQKIIEDILKILVGKSLSVSEIKKELNYDDNISGMVNLACDKFKLIRDKPIKSWRDKRHTYSAFKEYFPGMDLDSFTEKESRTRLIRYYLQCFGPVVEDDIVWWTGFTKTETKNALNEIENVSKIMIESLLTKHLILESDLSRIDETTEIKDEIINILPELDPYMMGYKERERYINTKLYNYCFDNSGNATSTILLNGKVIGIWDFISSKESLIKFFFLEKVEEQQAKKVKNQLREIGKFIFDEDISLKECKNMTPLKTRTPGEVQTPLKQC